MKSIARSALLLMSLVIMLFPIACDGETKEVRINVLVPDHGQYAMELQDGTVLPFLFTGPDAYLQLAGAIKVTRVIVLKRSSFIGDLLGTNSGNIERTMKTEEIQVRVLHFDGAQIVTTAYALNDSITIQFGDGLEVWTPDGRQLIATAVKDRNGPNVPSIGTPRIRDRDNFVSNSGNTTFETNTGNEICGERFTQNGWMVQETVNLSWNGGGATQTFSIAPVPGLNQALVASFAAVDATISAQNISPTTKVGQAGVVLFDITANPTTKYVGQDVNFGFASTPLTPAGFTGSLTYSWNFGDGSPLSSLSNPVHQYSSITGFTVTCTITGPGCSGVDNLNITVNPLGSVTVINITHDLVFGTWVFTFRAPDSFTGLGGDKTQLQMNYAQEPGQASPYVTLTILTLKDVGGGVYESDPAVPYGLADDSGTFKWWWAPNQGVQTGTVPNSPGTQTDAP